MKMKKNMYNRKVYGNILNEKKKKLEYYNIKVQHWDVYWMETLDN